MKEELPAYVVKCFIAAGFDTLEVIAKMNISNKPGNSIELIEQFISDEYPNNPEYMRSKKFPPGHRIRIQDFVNKVKHLMKPQLGKRTVSGGRSNQPKKTKANSGDTSDFDQPGNVGDIRRQIAKWQQTQKEPNVRKLKEHEHFEVSVTSTGAAYISCKICMKKCQLGSKKNKFLISNWTRHAVKCNEKKSSENRKIIDYASAPSPTPLSSTSCEYSSSPSSPSKEEQGEGQDEAMKSLEDTEDPLPGNCHDEQRYTEQAEMSFRITPPASSPGQEGDLQQ